MANQEQVDRLLQGVEAWNQWRLENRNLEVDLSEADLFGVDFSKAYLFKVDFRGANLRSANFGGAYLNGSDLRGADLKGVKFTTPGGSNAHFASANFSGANLSGANLEGCILNHINFSSADLKGIKLSEANLRDANLSHANLSGADLLGADLRGANLSYANLNGIDLTYAELEDSIFQSVTLSSTVFRSVNLRGIDFSKAILNDVDFSEAILNEGNFCGAILSNANFRGAQVLKTNFQAATLTGVCIQDWNINVGTNFQDVVCDYIFLAYDSNKLRLTDRRPHDPNRNFAPGEFTKRYQIVLETVELFFDEGIDWKAFLISLKDLQSEYGHELNIQGIEKKAGGSFLVRLEVPPDIDKGALELKAKEQYEIRLQVLEAQYHEKLQAKDREIEIYKQKSADILELAKLAASRPITVEQQVMVEQQSNSETYNSTVHGNVGNLANKMQDQASQKTNQYIGANLSEITSFIHALRSQAESFPEDKRVEVIDHLEDLETDLKQPPEKRKLSRMKATLLALVGIAATVSGAVANTNEFVGQVQELSRKLGIPLPIEQVEP